jgi:hypothetical protein
MQNTGGPPGGSPLDSCKFDIVKRLFPQENAAHCPADFGQYLKNRSNAVFWSRAQANVQ